MTLLKFNNHIFATRYCRLWEFSNELKQGEFNCIIANKNQRLKTIIEKLILAFSLSNKVVYISSNKVHGNRKLNSITNVSIKQVEKDFKLLIKEINDSVTHAKASVVFIEDLWAFTPKEEKQLLQNCKILKCIALDLNIVIITGILFETERSIREFLFPYNGRCISDFRKECFNRVFSTYKSIYSSYAGRKRLLKLFSKAHPEFQKQSITVFTTSFIGIEGQAYYDPAIPIILIIWPKSRKDRNFPDRFMGFNVNFMLIKD